MLTLDDLKTGINSHGWVCLEVPQLVSCMEAPLIPTRPVLIQTIASIGTGLLAIAEVPFDSDEICYPDLLPLRMVIRNAMCELAEYQLMQSGIKSPPEPYRRVRITGS